MKTKVSIRDFNFYGQPSCSLKNDSDILWDRTGVGPVVFFTDMCLTHIAHNRYKKSFKVAWLLEPEAISKWSYHFAFNERDAFDMIITHHLWFKQKLDAAGYKNCVLYVNGMTAIERADWEIYPKTKNISIIASEKNITFGHQLRHKVIAACPNKIDLYGRAYKPVGYKLDGIKDYAYHVAIENSSVDLYITEKVLDCFLTGTIPIYWGAPAINQIFNQNGILYSATPDELVENINLVSQGKINLIGSEQAIKDNFETAKKWAIPENWILEHVLKPRGLV